MKSLLFLIACFLLLPVKLSAEIHLSGMIVNTPGQEVRILVYGDQLSFRPIELKTVVTDQNGFFNAIVPVDETEEILVRVGHMRLSFYAEPGQSYLLRVEAPDGSVMFEGRDYHPLSYHYPRKLRQLSPGHLAEPMDAAQWKDTWLSEDIWAAWDEDLNRLVDSLVQKTAVYLERYVAGRPRANHAASLAAFDKELDLVFGHVDNAFFNTYRLYYLGYLARTLNTKSTSRLIEEFIQDRPVLYSHPMYMEFVRNLFDTYVFTEIPSVSMDDLLAAVNNTGSYEALIGLIENDTRSRQEMLHELLAVHALIKMIGIRAFDNVKVAGILEQASVNASHDYIKTMAGNLLEHHPGMQTDRHLTSASFRKASGEQLELSVFDGQHLYLVFMAGWCPVSMRELMPLSQIQHHFGDNLQVILVLIDQDEATYAHLMRQETPAYKVVHFDYDYRLLEYLGIRNIPHYTLIGPEGKIEVNPFISPSAGAMSRLENIINP